MTTGETPEEVWCAGGSGTLARGLAKAWPMARLNVGVGFGKELTVAGATMHQRQACHLGRRQGPSRPSQRTRIMTQKLLRFALPGTGPARFCSGMLPGPPIRRLWLPALGRRRASKAIHREVTIFARAFGLDEYGLITAALSPSIRRLSPCRRWLWRRPCNGQGSARRNRGAAEACPIARRPGRRRACRLLAAVARLSSTNWRGVSAFAACWLSLPWSWLWRPWPGPTEFCRCRWSLCRHQTRSGRRPLLRAVRCSRCCRFFQLSMVLLSWLWPNRSRNAAAPAWIRVAASLPIWA